MKHIKTMKRFSFGRTCLAALSCLILGTACVAPVTKEKPAHESFLHIGASESPELFDDGDLDSLKASLAQSLQWTTRQKKDRVFKIGDRSFTAEELLISLRRFESLLAQNPDKKALAQGMNEIFDIYASQGESVGKVMATGYYVPLIEGVFEPHPDFPIPVHSVPEDLVTISLGDFHPDLKGKTVRGRVEGNKFVKYWDRQDIREKQAIGEKARPIAWVKDEFDLFVIEIQGSGIVRTPKGEERIIGYAGQNGHPYKAVGKLLLDEEKIPREKMSMQAIREYVKANPEEMGRVLNYNPSFVFFKLSDNKVVGNLNVPLTAGRSVATDQKIYPSAVPLFIQVEKPTVDGSGNVSGEGKISRLVFNQDTGGAIRGPGRIDFFWGAGDTAAEMAGIMQHEGKVFALVPKKQHVAGR